MKYDTIPAKVILTLPSTDGDKTIELVPGEDGAELTTPRRLSYITTYAGGSATQSGVNPDIDEIFTDSQNITGRTRYVGAKIKLFYPDNTDYEFIIAEQKTRTKMNVNGAEVNGYTFTTEGKTGFTMPTGLVKDSKIGITNTDVKKASTPSDKAFEKVQAKVTFDLNGGKLATTVKSFEGFDTTKLPGTEFAYKLQRANDTAPVVRIAPMNEKAAGEEGYTPNGFKVAKYIDHNGDELKGDALALRKFVAEKPTIESADNLVFLGWTTKKLSGSADEVTEAFEKLQKDKKIAKTADQVNGTEAYIFNDESPITTATTVYAVYGKNQERDKYEPKYEEVNGKVGEQATVAAPTFTDKEGNPATPENVTYELGENPPKGAVVNADGSVTYTPVDGDAGNTVNVPVVVKYSDGTTDNVNAPINVANTSADKITKAGGLAPKATAAFVGDTLDWAGSAVLSDKAKQAANATELQGLLDKATITDATDPARTSEAAGEFTGKVKVTFEDKSSIVVDKQILYVYENGANKPGKDDDGNDKPLPKDAAVVTFTKDDESIKDWGTVEPIIVKKNAAVPSEKFPNAEAKDGYHTVAWDPAKDTVITGDKTFNASATKNGQTPTPVITAPKAGDKTITGTSEPNAKVVVELPDGTKVETTADKDGNWTANVPADKELKENDVVKAKATATGKTESKEGTATVGKADVKEDSKKPTVKQPTEGDDKITGEGEPGSKIVVKDEDEKTIGETTVKDDGTWEVPVPADKPLEKDDKITVEQTEDGKNPSTEETIVKGKDTPVIPTPDYSEKPIINPIYDSDDYVTGEGVPGATVEVRFPDGTVERVIVDGDGRWITRIPYPLYDEEIVEARQIEFGKEPSDWVQERVRYDDEYWRERDRRDRDDKKEDTKKPSKVEPRWTPPALNARDHFSYIKGYGNNIFGPNRTITRAEVAMIFARISVNQSTGGAPQFKDVKAGDWYKTAVDIMAKQGIVKGYEDGTFRPNQPITRREFAAIAARYAGNLDTWKTFRDVPPTDWAYKLINRVAGAGWINGYEDGTFRPNNNITRAEVVAIVNRMLNRKADAKYVDNNLMRTKGAFVDNMRSAWYYYDIYEAAFGHSYERLDNGVDEKWNRVTGQAFEIRER